MVRNRRSKTTVRVSKETASLPVAPEVYPHAPPVGARYPLDSSEDSLLESKSEDTLILPDTSPDSSELGSGISMDSVEGESKYDSTQGSIPKDQIPRSKESKGLVSDKNVRVQKDLRLKNKSKAVPVKNMATTAAITTHRHNKDKYPVVEYRIPKSREFDTNNIKLLNKIHPCKLDDLHSYSHSNEHPLCAAVRSIGEAYVINEVLNTLHDHNLSPDWILDVGGAGRRHVNMRRKYIWSCIPTQSAKDVLRRFIIPPGQHCEHSWSECHCHVFPISMSVHAIYYMSPQEIFDNVVRQQIPLHYALLHRYKGESGTLMNGEMSFVRQGGMLYVRANGNIHPYVHPAMDWLADGVVHVVGGTLVWEKCRGFLDSEVIRFHAVKALIPLNPVSSPVPCSSLCVDDKFETGKFDEIINQCALPHKEINVANRNKYLESIRRKGLANGLDIVRLLKYADEVYMSQEAVVAKVTPKIQLTAYERLVRLKMLTVGNDYVVPVFIISMLLAISMSFFDIFDSTSEALLYGLLAGTMVILATMCASRFKHYQTFDTGLPKLSILSLVCGRLEAWKVRAKVVDYCCTLTDKPSDPRKLIALKVPDDYYDECEARDAAYAMVYSPRHPPYFPRKCSHNVVSSVKNKLAQVIPGAGSYSLPLHSVLLQIAKEASGTIQPLDWESWVSRFPGPKQARLRREYDESLDDLIEDWNASNFFPKFEAYPEPKYPRPILASKVQFNFAIGRWLIPLAEFLADNLPENICFPLHGDSNAIGEYRMSMAGYVEMDCDFSAFDSSQDESALEIVFTFLEFAGVPSKVVNRCRQDKDLCVIRNRKGLKVLMRACRFSGRSETLLGNTLITLNTALHVFGERMAGAMVKGDDTTLYLDPQYEYDVGHYIGKYLEQGLVAKLRSVDDYEVEFCSSIFVPTIDSEVLVVKPGKLLAKTFWCKNLEYGPLEMEKQFASILKGLANNLQDLPGIRGLYRNPVYLKWFDSVEAHYDLYNEYATQYTRYDGNAVTFLCERYQITASELADLEVELASSFPIRLQSLAAISMIEKDWAASNDATHLTEIIHDDNNHSLHWSILIEEAFCHIVPFGWLLLGLAESGLTGDWRHLMGHAILHLCRTVNGFLSIFVHTFNNCVAGTIQLSVIMAGRKNKPSKRAKKRANKKTRKTKPRMSPYMAMLSDPCNAQLIPGIYGDDSGILAKYKSSSVFGETETSGFLLWCPTGTSNTAVSPLRINSIYYYTNNPATKPTNTGANPFGNSVSGGIIMPLGANGFKLSSSCADFRVLSACMKLIYTGDTSACKGRVAFINGLPTTALLQGSGGSPMSVNDLFAYATVTERTQLDAMENRFRPISDYSKFFKNDLDAPLIQTAGQTTRQGSDANRFGEVWFGFAWTGVATNQLAFETYENIEWKPEAAQGFVGQQTVSRSARDYVRETVSQLDDIHPGWQNSLMDNMVSIGSEMARAALGGAGMLGGAYIANNRLRIRG